MKYQRFEELPVWIDSKNFVLMIYSVLGNCKDFAYREQILKASLSIMNNIAEGYERKGNRELVKFLYYSKGSAGEVRSMLYIGKELNYISEDKYNQLYTFVENISKQITGFIKSLEN